MAVNYPYKTRYARQVGKLCKLGASRKEIADFFGVPESTLKRWEDNNYDFREALRIGSLDADANVAKALYKRATGFYAPEDKIYCNNLGEVTVVPTRKYYPPETNAAKFWLKNRRPDLWKEMPEDNGGDNRKPAEFIVKLADGTRVNNSAE